MSPVLLLLAADYHVSAEGAAGAAGTEADPFPTIQDCADVAAAGDRCVVHAGVYRESVVPAASGTADAPVRFEVADGERAIVTGLDVAEGWTNSAGNRWTLKAAPITQLFIDKGLGVEARWPDSEPDWLRASFASMDGVTEGDDGIWTVTDDSLAATTDWSGATACFLHEHRWVAYSAPVVAAGEGWVQIDASGAPHAPAEGSPYYLYGTTAALSAAGEWVQDDDGLITLVSDTEPSGVEVRTRRYGFDLEGASHVAVAGFDLFAATVRLGGEGSSLSDCRVLYPAPFEDVGAWTKAAGVEVSGSGHTVTRCEIAHSWGDGVTLDGAQASDNLIHDNLIHDVDWAGTNGAGIGGDSSPGNTYSSNTIFDAGRSGIVHRWATYGTQIVDNDIYGYGWLTRDLGGIYTYGREDGTPETVIARNRVHDSMSDRYGDGIYLDNHVNDIQVHHNVVWNVTTGIRLNAPGDSLLIAGNTLWSVSSATATYAVDGGTLTDTRTVNNLSSAGEFLGSDVSSNLVVDEGCFADVAAGDFCLTASCAAVDSGEEVSGVTDGYTGSAPDLGACEGGCPAAGISWTAEARHWYPLTTLSPSLDLSFSPEGKTVDGDTLLMGAESSGQDWRSAVLFDAPDLDGGRLVRAVLEVTVVNTDAYGSIQVGRITAEPWDASTASAALGDDIEALGFIARTGHSPAYDAPKVGTHRIDVTDTVAGWLDGSLPVSGFALLGAEGYSLTGRTVGATEGGQGPALVLEIEPAEAAVDTGDTGGGTRGDTAEEQPVGDTGGQMPGDSWGPAVDTGTPEEAEGCGCGAASGGAGWVVVLAVLGWRRRQSALGEAPGGGEHVGFEVGAEHQGEAG